MPSRKYPKTFSPLYINMVKASELSGSFGHMLERIVEYLNSAAGNPADGGGRDGLPGHHLRHGHRHTTFLLVFVVPQFVSIFKGKEHILPVPTKVLLFLSAFMRTYWYMLIVAAGGRRLEPSTR